ncbi:MAG: metallophosphoesterase [Kiritimatiellia bacterium]
MIWITGDKHGDFEEVDAFCYKQKTCVTDTLILLGDAGINYYTDARGNALRQHLAQLPITFFCIHGNHEARPDTLPKMQLQPAFGGHVYVDARYPNQLYPVDGALYTIGTQKVLVIGGAYSIDKFYRLRHHWEWFEDEQPSSAIKTRTEMALKTVGWKVDCVLSHTCPRHALPLGEIPALDLDLPIDYTTEDWLETLRQQLSYKKWYCGHFHIDFTLEEMTFLYHQILLFDT